MSCYHSLRLVMAVAVTPKDFAEVQSQLSSRGSVYERQKYLRGLAVSHSRENVDKLIDELISEGTSDISKANWAHSNISTLIHYLIILVFTSM